MSHLPSYVRSRRSSAVSSFLTATLLVTLAPSEAAAATQPASATSTLPAGARSALDRDFRGWAPLKAASFCDGSQGHTIVSGRFNGDRVPDYAVRVAIGPRGYIVALLSQPKGYSTLVLETAGTRDMTGMVLDLERQGSTQRVIDDTNKPRGRMELRLDAPVGGNCNSSAYIYRINGRKVSHDFISD